MEKAVFQVAPSGLKRMPGAAWAPLRPMGAPSARQQAAPVRRVVGEKAMAFIPPPTVLTGRMVWPMVWRVFAADM